MSATTLKKPNSSLVFFAIDKPCKVLPRKNYKPKSSPIGSKYSTKVDLSFGEHGEKIAKPGAKIDFDAMIQSCEASTDIHAIVARAKLGDLSVLNVHQNGFIGDVTELPKDIYDYKRMNDLYDRVKGSFDSLPEAVQVLFKGSADEYLNAILTDQAAKIINDYKEAEAAKSAAGSASEGDAE